MAEDNKGKVGKVTHTDYPITIDGGSCCVFPTRSNYEANYSISDYWFS